MRNPWTKIKSRLAYETPWFKVIKDDVIGPDGKNNVYDIIRTKGGVGVVTLNDKGELYLVGQYRYATDGYSIEIPKGAFESFHLVEEPLEAAQRELKEETGISANRWIELATVHTLVGHSDDTVHLFLATDLAFGHSFPDDTEEIRLFAVPLAEIGKVIRDGLSIDGERAKMTDATSITAILLAKDLVECSTE